MLQAWWRLLSKPKIKHDIKCKIVSKLTEARRKRDAFQRHCMQHCLGDSKANAIIKENKSSGINLEMKRASYIYRLTICLEHSRKYSHFLKAIGIKRQKLRFFLRLVNTQKWKIALYTNSHLEEKEFFKFHWIYINFKLLRNLHEK